MAIIGKIYVEVQFFMVVLLLLISSVSCLQCYKCYSTSRECYNGNPEYLPVLNCSNKNEVCVTFQYETEADSNPSYVTTIRGCQPSIKDGICNQLMKTKSNKKIVQKGILCTTCDKDLCNSSTIMNLSSTVLSIVVVLLLIILKI